MLRPSSAPLHQVHDAALLDLDGVLYLGAEPIAHAAEAVATAREGGLRTAFVTNNSSRRAATVAEHLSELGIPAVADDVITSSQAVVGLLQRRLPPGARVLVVGSDGLAEELAEGGFAPVREAEGAVAVVQGLDPRTDWSDLAEAAVALASGALWVAGNTDSTFPSPRGLLPGNGAMVQALTHTTGQRPVVVGKPEPELFRASVERVRAQRPLVVGDRLDTDIVGANRASLPSLLVLTGVTTRQELLAAPPEHRPTYVSSDLRGLVSAHPEVTVDGGTARCGESFATADGPSDDSDDALRASCALAWIRSGS